ncbi:hypothetical protein ACFLU6_04670 [Acidobacteriota bacterium]
MAFRDAYWISPSGEIILVGTSHIQELISHPERFGLTSSEVQDAYTKHRERLGLEGKAREELIRKVVAKDFVRIRKYGNEGYSITVHRLTEETKALIRGWAAQVLSGEIGEEDDHFADVTVSAISEDHQMRTSLEKIVRGT